jgi:hypothetical protein
VNPGASKPALIRNAHSRTAHVFKSIAMSCVFAILLVGTLQATHIHKDWLRSSPLDKSLRADSGKDAQCVFCLTSHAAAGLPQHSVVDQVQTSAADLVPDKSDKLALVDLHSDTIRPPPMA